MKLRHKRILIAYIFLAVPLLFFIFVRFYPMVYAFWIGFTDWNLLTPVKDFIGFKNYINIFKDPVFIRSLFNTFEYTAIGVPVVIIISLFIAIFINRIKYFQGFYRLLYVMPYITPLVAVSWVWRWLYQKAPIGFINNVLVFWGLPSQSFLFSPNQALLSIAITTIWVNMGYCIVIFLAGLQTIPQEFIEAAKIDGANRSQILFKIIIPLLNPIIVLLIVLQSISFLRIFTQVYNMSFQGTGGPLNSTKPIVLYIYQKAFVSFDMGTAASATTILFFMIMGITLLQMLVLRKKFEY